MRMACVLIPALLWIAGPSVAQSFDPRKPPPVQEIRSLVKEVKKAWKRADAGGRKTLLDRLADVDHHLTLEALVDCCRKVPGEICFHAIGLLPLWDAKYLEKELPRLLRIRSGNHPTYQACVQLAVEQQVHACLPEIRRTALERVAPSGSPGTDQPARTRTLCLVALGEIKHEDNLPVLVEVMEQYAGLETEQVQHGDGGDQGWPCFYIPARTSFCAITLSGVSTSAEARAWLRDHPEFRVQRGPTTRADR